MHERDETEITQDFGPAEPPPPPPPPAPLTSVDVQQVVEDAAKAVFVHCSDVNEIGAVTVSVADWVEPLSVAVMIGA